MRVRISDRGFEHDSAQSPDTRDSVYGKRALRLPPVESETCASVQIASLRDYADALVGAKVGQPVSVVVLRDRKKLTRTMTPGGHPEDG